MGYIIDQLSDEHLVATLAEAREAYRQAEADLASARATLNAIEAEQSRRWRRAFAEYIERPRLKAALISCSSALPQARALTQNKDDGHGE